MVRARPLVVAAAVVLAAPLVHVSGARAQAGDPQRAAAAQALYEQGVAAMDKRDYATACPKLEEVVNLVPEGIGAQLSLAQCYEEAGHLASAWTTYALAEAAALKAGQKARAQWAHQRAAALRPKLAELTIDVPEALQKLPGLEIQRDGFPVGRAQWGTPVPADRGSHVIVVKAAGKEPWEKTIDIASNGIAMSITIEELIEKRDASNADGRCDSSDWCDEEGLALRSEGLTAARISTALIIAGGVAVAGGVTLFVTAPSSAAPRGAKVSIAPQGLRLSGTW